MKAITKLLGLCIGILILSSSCSMFDKEPGEEYTPPSAVTNLEAKVTGNTVKLSWTNPPEERFNRVLIEYFTSYKHHIVVEDGSEENSITDLDYNTKYTFSVYALSETGHSSEAVEISITTEKNI